MDADVCWFCHGPILSGEAAHRSPHGNLAVHADCLRHDALVEGIRPTREDAPGTAYCRG